MSQRGIAVTRFGGIFARQQWYLDKREAAKMTHQSAELTTLTLVAIHPVDIAAHFHPRSLDLRVIFADQIIELGVGLARATTYYRIAANEVLASRH